MIQCKKINRIAGGFVFFNKLLEHFRLALSHTLLHGVAAATFLACLCAADIRPAHASSAPAATSFLASLAIFIVVLAIIAWFIVRLWKRQLAAQKVLQRRERMLERTEKMARLASFEWDVDTNIVTWSPEMFCIFGRDPALGIPNLEGQVELYTPYSTQLLFDAVSKAVSDGTAYELELMTVQPDGEQRPCFIKGFPERDRSGRVVRVAGLVQDITERKNAEAKLQYSEELFRSTFKLMPASLTLQTTEGVILECSDEFCHATGVAREDVIGHNALELNLWADPEQRVALRQTLQRDGLVNGIEFQMRRHDGGSTSMQMSARYMTLDNKPLLLTFAHDISQRKEAETKLLASLKQIEMSRALIEAVVDGSPSVIYAFDTAGRFLFVNRTFEKLFGGSRSALLGKTRAEGLVGIMPPDIAEEHFRNDQVVIASGQTYEVEEHNLEHDGMHVYLTQKHPMRDADGHIFGIAGTSTDITERVTTQQALQISLKEKTALLLEVHHRVKNNLQVITSLLRLESYRTEHDATKIVLKDMQGRIRAMALLHETIYRKGNFAAIDLGSYISQIARESLKNLLDIPGTVQLRLDMGTVQVGLDQATPCGLLMSELLSNCLKHGFPEGQYGEIKISLQALDEAGQWRLMVSDTGVGLSADFDSRRQKSLGLQLVNDLASQMGGALYLGAGPVAVFTVDFTVEIPAPIKINLVPENTHVRE